MGMRKGDLGEAMADDKITWKVSPPLSIFRVCTAQPLPRSATRQPAGRARQSASERRWSSLKVLKGLDLKAKARI